MQRNATQNAPQTVKPRTDGQVFLDKFYLLMCTAKFYLTRSLVQKLVMPALQQGNLLVCVNVKENLTRNCAVGSCASIYLFVCGS